MPFPRIDACIICEGVRREINNKHILLGYYGITPYVQVSLTNLQAPAILCFVFSGGSGQPGVYDLSLRLTDQTGKVISNPTNAPDIKGVSVTFAPSTNVFFTFQGILSQAGRYEIALWVNGVQHYTTTLGIGLAPKGMLQ